jgi:hypothetical protein
MVVRLTDRFDYPVVLESKSLLNMCAVYGFTTDISRPLEGCLETARAEVWPIDQLVLLQDKYDRFCEGPTQEYAENPDPEVFYNFKDLCKEYFLPYWQIKDPEKFEKLDQYHGGTEWTIFYSWLVKLGLDHYPFLHVEQKSWPLFCESYWRQQMSRYLRRQVEFYAMELRGDQPASLEDVPLRREPKDLQAWKNQTTAETEIKLDTAFEKGHMSISKEFKSGWMRKVGFLQIDDCKELTPSKALQYLKVAWRTEKLTIPHIMRILGSIEVVAMYALIHLQYQKLSWAGAEKVFMPYPATCFMDLTGLRIIEQDGWSKPTWLDRTFLTITRTLPYTWSCWRLDGRSLVKDSAAYTPPG